MSEAILFVDCDRFYFAVEAAETPGLAADPRPVIIGRDPRQSPRGVVTTANDAARALGIASGMSCAVVLRRAPNAVFLPPRFPIYSAYSRRVMAVLRSESPLVQQNSVDEAALKWPHGYTRDPAVALRLRVLAETGISVSLGLAPSPLVAKMASETAKSAPDHLHVVEPGGEPAFLAPLPIRALVGVGPKSEIRLQELGIATIGELAERPLDSLLTLFGRSHGRYLHDAARGIDGSDLQSERVTKSISAERTFGQDTRDRRELWLALQSQAEEVAGRVRGEGLLAGEVAIKLRYADWTTMTRQTRLPSASADASIFAQTAAGLMKRHWDPSRPIRLLGLRAGHLVDASLVAASSDGPTQLTLFHGTPNV